jgi:hypothetical protein
MEHIHRLVGVGFILSMFPLAVADIMQSGSGTKKAKRLSLCLLVGTGLIGFGGVLSVIHHPKYIPIECSHSVIVSGFTVKLLSFVGFEFIPDDSD